MEKDSQSEDEIQLITEWPIQAEEVTFKGGRHGTSNINNPKLVEGSVEQTSMSSLCVKHNLGLDHDDNSVKFAKFDKEPLATFAIARWWRRCGRNLIDRNALPSLTGANTLIGFISRTSEGQRFMKEEIERLRNKVDNSTVSSRSSPDVYAALGSFLEKVGQYEKAFHYLEEIVPSEEKEYRWLYHKVQRQLNVQRSQSLSLQNLQTSHTLRFPPKQKVDRVTAGELTFEDFFRKYALTSTPVIITDMVCKMTSQNWDINHMRKIAGDCEVTLEKPVKESVEWARLENCETVLVKDFIDGIHSTHRGKYLFDWSLPLNCPTLAKELTIPCYFAGDFLQRTSPGSLYQDSWPSLFIAGPGLNSDLHVDAFGSNFWMALFQGTKRWTFFPKEDLPLLYPRYENSLDPVFDVGLDNPDFTRFPLLSLTHPIECILQPGELLFVPAGCPHRVENLETSVAISSNYVDLSNFDLVLKELEVNSIIDPRAAELHKQFRNDKFCSDMCKNIHHLPWCEFKSFKRTVTDTESVYTKDNITE